jgi:hypothetical protein
VGAGVGEVKDGLLRATMAERGKSG